MTEKNDRNGWQASLPPRWLNDSTYRGLSVRAWALFSWTLAWGVGQENDGRVKLRDLPFIAAPMLNSSEAAEAAVELVAVDLWASVDDGYQVLRWEQSQPTAAEMEEKRAGWRRKNNLRKPKASPSETRADTPRVDARDSASNGTLHVRTNATYDMNATDATTSTGREERGPRFTESPAHPVADRATGEVLDEVGSPSPVPEFESYVDELGRTRKRRRPAA